MSSEAYFTVVTPKSLVLTIHQTRETQSLMDVWKGKFGEASLQPLCDDLQHLLQRRIAFLLETSVQNSSFKEEKGDRLSTYTEEALLTWKPDGVLEELLRAKGKAIPRLFDPPSHVWHPKKGWIPNPFLPNPSESRQDQTPKKEKLQEELAFPAKQASITAQAKLLEKGKEKKQEHSEGLLQAKVSTDAAIQAGELPFSTLQQEYLKGWDDCKKNLLKAAVPEVKLPAADISELLRRLEALEKFLSIVPTCVPAPAKGA